MNELKSIRASVYWPMFWAVVINFVFQTIVSDPNKYDETNLIWTCGLGVCFLLALRRTLLPIWAYDGNGVYIYYFFSIGTKKTYNWGQVKRIGVVTESGGRGLPRKHCAVFMEDGKYYVIDGLIDAYQDDLTTIIQFAQDANSSLSIDEIIRAKLKAPFLTLFSNSDLFFIMSFWIFIDLAEIYFMFIKHDFKFCWTLIVTGGITAYVTFQIYYKFKYRHLVPDETNSDLGKAISDFSAALNDSGSSETNEKQNTVKKRKKKRE